jgi:predicted metal-dependent hydrolase
MPLFSSPSVLPVYVLQRSRRRTVAIHVKPDRIEVRAPLRAASRDIDTFVRQKSEWIMAKQRELHARSTETISVHDGAIIEVLAEHLQIRWRAAVRAQVLRENDVLWIAGRALDEARVQRLLQLWLVEEAEKHLLPRAEALVQRMALQERCSGFTLRYTRSLWGRCSSRGEILFNPLILFAPLSVMDYLVAHEVCHLRHMNHSPQFWGLVESVCPDWQVSRKWLKVHGHRLRVG